MRKALCKVLYLLGFARLAYVVSPSICGILAGRNFAKGFKRALRVIACAALGVHSPSLRRRVRISDIWRSPEWE